MSNYILCKAPNLQLNLMIDEQFAPQMVSYIQRMGCTYAKEAHTKPINGRIYTVLKDIQGKTGAELGELIGLFYSLEWGSLTEGEAARKFYIMVSQKRKEKKHASKTRKETGSGSNGGNRGESSCDPGQGPVDGSVGDGFDAGVIGANDLWELPRVE